jgi:hypothetical protein
MDDKEQVLCFVIFATIDFLFGSEGVVRKILDFFFGSI